MSKETELLAAQLVPTSKTPRLEQFRIAWDLLLHRPDADEWHRAQAKCWLTYRAFDGQVTMEDWKAKIFPVQVRPSGFMATRWMFSQKTAEAYLWLHHGTEEERAKKGWGNAEIVYGASDRVQQYAPTILNWLRVTFLVAYRAWATGDDQRAKEIIGEAVKVWSASTSFDWSQNPTRFPEMIGDCYALSMFMFLAQRLELTRHMINRSWISPTIIGKHYSKDPWMIVLREIQTEERNLWS